MKSMRMCCSVLALSTLSLFGGQMAKAQQAQVQTASNTITLTSDGAVRIAMQQAISVQTANLGVDRSVSEKRRTGAGLLPTINVVGSYSYMLKKQKVYFGGDDAPAGGRASFLPADGIEMGQTHNVQAGVNASMPLIAPQLWASLRVSDSEIALAQEKARGSKVSLEAEVRKAYMACLLARESERVLQANYDNAKNNYEQALLKFKQGLVAEYDVVRLDAQVKNILPNLVQARQSIELADTKLKVLMGFDPEQSIAISERLTNYQDMVYSQLKPRTDSVDLKGNVSLRTLDLQGNQLEAGLTAKKMGYLPTLGVSFNYMYNFASNQFKLSNSKRWSPSSVIGINLSIPLFSGGSTYFDVKSTKNQLQQLGLQRLEAERQLRLSSLNSQSEQRRATEQFVAAKEAVKSAEKGYSISQVRYKTGEGTLLELNDADLVLLQARLNYNQSIYNYMVSVYSLRELEGKTTIE